MRVREVYADETARSVIERYLEGVRAAWGKDVSRKMKLWALADRDGFSPMLRTSGRSDKDKSDRKRYDRAAGFIVDDLIQGASAECLGTEGGSHSERDLRAEKFFAEGSS